MSQPANEVIPFAPHCPIVRASISCTKQHRSSIPDEEPNPDRHPGGNARHIRVQLVHTSRRIFESVGASCSTGV